MAKDPFVDFRPPFRGYLPDNRPRFTLPPMPGLIPYLPTPPLPQPTRTTSSSIARPVNNFLSADRGPARGSSSQAPIELDSDSEPTPPGPQSATTNPSTTTTSSTSATDPAQPQPQNNLPWDLWNWAALTPDSTQQPPQALPSFSDFAANLDLDTLDATLLSAAAPHTPAREPNSDDFLSALVDGNFSSPSSYPQSVQASSGNRSNGASTQNHLGSLRPNRPAPTLPNTVATAAGPRRSTPRPSVFEDNDIEESLFVSSDNEPEDIMPVQTRRRASTIISSDNDPDEVVPTSTTRKRAAPSSTAVRGAATSTKRRRTSQTSATRARTTSTAPRATPTKIEDDDDIFGDKEFEKGKGKEEKDEDAIDLVASNEVPQELLVPKEDKRIKLSAFTCVICMDDVTALTVTHCGHLFCSECLHSALNVDATKNKCPICRQKVETKDRSDYTSKTKGFWPLELKLMTASRKGKQKA